MRKSFKIIPNSSILTESSAAAFEALFNNLSSISGVDVNRETMEIEYDDKDAELINQFLSNAFLHH